MAFQSDSPVESANEFKKRLHTSLEDAWFVPEVSKSRNAAYASQQYTLSSCKRGDKIWLKQPIFRDSISPPQKSEKLGSKRFVPFTIQKTIGKSAVWLEISDNIKLYPVVHGCHTQPHFKQPEKVEQPLILCSSLTIGSNEKKLFELEEIFSHRQNERGY